MSLYQLGFLGTRHPSSSTRSCWTLTTGATMRTRTPRTPSTRRHSTLSRWEQRWTIIGLIFWGVRLLKGPAYVTNVLFFCIIWPLFQDPDLVFNDLNWPPDLKKSHSVYVYLIFIKRKLSTSGHHMLQTFCCSGSYGLAWPWFDDL